MLHANKLSTWTARVETAYAGFLALVDNVYLENFPQTSRKVLSNNFKQILNLSGDIEQAVYDIEHKSVGSMRGSGVLPVKLDKATVGLVSKLLELLHFESRLHQSLVLFNLFESLVYAWTKLSLV